MDQQNNGQPSYMGVLGGPDQNSYLMNQYQTDGVAGESIGLSSNATHPAGLSAASSQLAQNQLAFQHIHQQQQQQQQLQEQLQNFWAGQRQEIEQVNDFKNHNLPLARIKKIMKADEDVRMISAEAPVLFSRACEMFILELTMRAWNHTEENKRRTLQRNDIAMAITRTDIFDFLVDIVPKEDTKEEEVSPLYKPGSAAFEGPADGVPYYYMPPSQTSQLNAPGMSIGNPMMDQLSYAQQPHPYAQQPHPYAQQPHPYAVQQMWPQHQLPPPDSS